MYGLVGFAIGAALRVAYDRGKIPKPFFNSWTVPTPRFGEVERGALVTWFGYSIGGFVASREQ